MKTINLQFDSLKFIPVTNSDGQLFAFNVELFPERLHNSPEGTVFTCNEIGQDGNLTDRVFYFDKSELTTVWVQVLHA